MLTRFTKKFARGGVNTRIWNCSNCTWQGKSFETVLVYIPKRMRLCPMCGEEVDRIIK